MDYVYALKSTADQYDSYLLDWSGKYMCNSLDPSLMDNILKNTTAISPGPVVLVETFVTIPYVSFETTEN